MSNWKDHEYNCAKKYQFLIHKFGKTVIDAEIKAFRFNRTGSTRNKAVSSIYRRYKNYYGFEDEKRL